MAPKTRHLSAPSADTAVPLAPTRGVASAICLSQPASAQTRTSFRAWHGLFQTGVAPSCSNGNIQGCPIRLRHPMSTGPTISLLACLLPTATLSFPRGA
ncbi:hypothetical protein CCMA1212_009527 [Trichoderma ghanense]|uniref:Uncharacterized protein n=1 Tax=Trichoderma ghanense TaxID=65468 RepID=A0ABY2GRW1_9HYPO